MKRYRRLLEIVRDEAPKRVIEIGTWSGLRAAQFMALTDCFYIGFDLFEDAEPETDTAEKNVKPHFSIVDVSTALDKAGFEKYLLVRGNTRHTLPSYLRGEYSFPNEELPKADFAFIDGGHSVETIKSDWEHIRESVKPGATVIFDDYYTPEVEGFGCNQIVKDLEHEVLEDRDPVRGGGSTSLVVVRA